MVGRLASDLALQQVIIEEVQQFEDGLYDDLLFLHETEQEIFDMKVGNEPATELETAEQAVIKAATAVVAQQVPRPKRAIRHSVAGALALSEALAMKAAKASKKAAKNLKVTKYAAIKGGGPT